MRREKRWRRPRLSRPAPERSPVRILGSLATRTRVANLAADKNRVGTASLLPVRFPNPDETLLADLGELASRMLRQGHRPSSFLLVRLTDGRIKIIQSESGAEQAAEDLRRITNEYGPVGTAFRVWTEEESGELLARVDCIADSREAVAGRPRVPISDPSDRTCRNRIRGSETLERFLGMADLTPHWRSVL